VVGTLALAVLVGVSLGLLGGGGSILTVPILLYSAHLPPKEAIATSLVVVGLAAAFGMLQQIQHVRWRSGLLFGGAAMIGAYGGGRIAAFIPGEIILVLFGLVMIASAVGMLLRKDPDGGSEKTRPSLPTPLIVLEGSAVGFTTGLIGAGGGFLIVPALAILGGLPMRNAIATSLFVISVNCFAGLFGYLGHVNVDLRLALAVSAAAITGSVAGARLARDLSPKMLRQGFAVFVILMALVIIEQQLPVHVR
jgi:uncharacterized protein